MSDKAVITGNSTLGESMKEVAVETPETTPTPTESQTSSTSVTPTGELETINVPAPEPAPIEDNSSAFDIQFGEENKPQEGQTQQQQTDWRTALKSVDRKELLNELGITEFAAQLSDYQKKGGKTSDFIAAKGINWNDVADIDLVRAEFDAKYPTLTKEQKAYKFNKMYVANEADDENEAMDKSINLQTAAYESRQRRIAEQQNFKEPEVIQPEQNAEYTNWQQQQTQLNTNREAFKNFLINHEATKSLLQNKRVAIPVDDKGTVYNFTIDKPEAVINALSDGGKIWSELIKNAQGEPDISKQQQIILFASNPQKFIGQIFNYGKMQGIKQKVSENNNVLPVSGTMPRNGAVNQTERDAWKSARSSTLGGN
jgi:hypothetical protein